MGLRGRERFSEQPESAGKPGGKPHEAIPESISYAPFTVLIEFLGEDLVFLKRRFQYLTVQGSAPTPDEGDVARIIVDKTDRQPRPVR
jgi:hypothetical protein